MTPVQGRSLVAQTQIAFKVGERRVCRTMRFSRSTIRYRSVADLLKSAFGKEYSSKNAALQIRLVVTNTSASRKIEYRTLSRRRFVGRKNVATLTDNFGNDYKSIDYGSMDAPQGRTHSESLYPKKSVTDVLVFETPVEAAEFLNIERPLKLIEIDAIGRFRISISDVIEIEQ